jgi:4-amino-4-deoxy-L-arabinose transferase-like glycosyltransferase
MRLAGSRPLLFWSAVALCLGTWAVLRGWFETGIRPAPIELRGMWIRSANPDRAVGEFRKDLVIGGAVRAAWVAISADEGFELVVNGRAAGHSIASRTTHPFQIGLSARGQQIGDVDPMIDLNFPREYQWRGHRSYLVPTFFDVAQYLQRGQNSLCVHVESREAPARLALDGEIVLWSGERVRIDSDTTFKASVEPPEDGQNWTEAAYSDLAWPPAVLAEAPAGRALRILDPAVYAQPFGGRWLGASLPFHDAIWFETTWRIDGSATGAWARVMSDRPFVLFINDVPVRVSSAHPGDLDLGEWELVAPSLMDPLPAPEPLDRGEVGALFAGARLDTPAETAAERPEFAELDERAAGGLQSLKARPTPQTPLGLSPALVGPKELRHDPGSLRLFGYGIEHLLRQGENKIALRAAAPEQPAGAWPPRIALDAGATLSNGSTISLREDSRWTARSQAPTGNSSPSVAAVLGALAAAPDSRLPTLEYRGVATQAPCGPLSRIGIGAVLTAVAIFLLLCIPKALRWVRERGWRARAAADDGLTSTRVWSLALPSALLFAVWLVDVSWRDRDDALLLLSAASWHGIVGLSLALGAAVPLVREAIRAPWALPSRWLRVARGRTAAHLALTVVLVACAFVRLHRVGLQPWEDDELSSAQAILGIADTGVPQYSPDVYYTRSPLYHYLAAACVRLLGHNIWALRLPSIVFAVATAWLIAHVGARLLGSRWTGLVAAALYAFHPYAIFVGHFVRFYQQQQFFTLLTAYFFCRGFVGGQQPRARLLAVGAFLASCLSQELSVVMVVPLAVAYVLFAEKADRRSSRHLWVFALCAVVVFALDYVVVLTATQTKLDGISPNVEPMIAPHFANPLHFLTLFVSYSRLHIALSVLLLASLPLVLAGRNRNAIALYIILFGGVAAVNLLVTLEALRYLYWLLPFWLLLGVYGLRTVLLFVSRSARGDPAVRWCFVPALGAMALLAVLASWSPWKTWTSYGAKIVGDSTSAFAYVRSSLRPGDAVAATEPQPPASLLEVGRSDYDLTVPLLHDFVYRKDGRLIDRNAGAEVIATLEQLESAIAAHDRLWIIVNRTKMRSRGQDVLWDLPAGRVEAFLRENCELKHESFMYAVFLWDAQVGRYRSFRQHGTPSM